MVQILIQSIPALQSSVLAGGQIFKTKIEISLQSAEKPEIISYLAHFFQANRNLRGLYADCGAYNAPMKLLMVDNYDSFTYNIVQYFCELGAEVLTFRNDEITIAEIEAQQPDRLVISPGPCSPKEAGISVAAIQYFAGKLPILGVCLGHQAIGEAFGGKIVRAQELMHGKTSVITTTQEGVFRGLPRQFTVNRYHSLAIEPASMPACLRVTARTEDGEVMGIKHTSLPIEGVQFHPESILTEHGHALLKNFLD